MESEEIKDDRWNEVIAPRLQHYFDIKRGEWLFKAMNKAHWVEEPRKAEKVWEAVSQVARLSASFCNDYGDHCEGLTIPAVEDVKRWWDDAVVRVIHNIIRYDDPFTDGMSKAMSVVCQSMREDTEIRKSLEDLLQAGSNKQ